jgi:hypothetical protein
MYPCSAFGLTNKVGVVASHLKVVYEHALGVVLDRNRFDDQIRAGAGDDGVADA